MVTKTYTRTWLSKNKIIPILTIALAGLLLANPSLGQEWKTVTGYYTRPKGIRKNRQRDRDLAKADALRSACEELGVTIRSITSVKDFVTQFDSVETDAKQHIEYREIDQGDYTDSGDYKIIIKFKAITTETTDQPTSDQTESAKNNQSQPKIPYPESNKLVIKVLRAYNIPSSHLLRTSNTYVIATIYSVQIGRTITVKDNPNPVWNQAFSVPTYKGEPIRFDVYDQGITKPTWIGCVTLGGVKYNQFDQEEPYKQNSGTYNIIKPGVAGTFGQLVLSFDTNDQPTSEDASQLPPGQYKGKHHIKTHQ